MKAKYLATYVNKRLIQIVIALAAALLCGWAGAEPVKLEYKVIRSFSTLFNKTGGDPLAWNINSPDGLAWDGSGLWVSACDSKVFAKLDANTGALITQMTLPDSDMLGGDLDHLAWDGKYLWGAIHSMPGDPTPDGRLVQIDLAAKRIIKTIEVPFRDAATMSPMGIAWDGKYVWSVDVKEKQIYRIDPATGEGKDKPIYATPTFNNRRITPCGITWDNYGCLWISDLQLEGFFNIDAKTGQLVHYLIPPDNPDPTKYGNFRQGVNKLFTGHATDGKRTWIQDEMEGNPLIYEIDVTFPTTGPCAHPVALAKTCVPGGQPFCESTAVCYGEAAAKTCTPKCSGAEKSCPTGTICQTKPEGEVCLPGSPGAFGESCTGAAGCASKVCVVADGETTGFCSSKCDESSPCETGYTCGTQGDQSVCVKATAVENPPGQKSGGCTVSTVRTTASAYLVLFLATALLLSLLRRTAGRRK